MAGSTRAPRPETPTRSSRRTCASDSLTSATHTNNNRPATPLNDPGGIGPVIRGTVDTRYSSRGSSVRGWIGNGTCDRRWRRMSARNARRTRAARKSTYRYRHKRTGDGQREKEGAGNEVERWEEQVLEA